MRCWLKCELVIIWGGGNVWHYFGRYIYIPFFKNQIWKKSIYLNWILNLQVWTHYKITWTQLINIVPHPRHKSHLKSHPWNLNSQDLSTNTKGTSQFLLLELNGRHSNVATSSTDFPSKTWFLEFIWTSGCPWPKATVKSPMGACDLIFSYFLLFIWFIHFWKFFSFKIILLYFPFLVSFVSIPFL